MKSKILIIIRKELTRLFSDKRMMISILMPGILIYIMYSVIGEISAEQLQATGEYQYQIYTINMPTELYEVFSDIENMAIKEKDIDATDSLKEEISNNKAELLLIFPSDFGSLIENYEIGSEEYCPPEISVYYNSVSSESLTAYEEICGMLDEYESFISNVFNVNSGNCDYDLATDEDTVAGWVSILVPIIMITFLFSGCSSVAAEAIAGEKERGTMAALLLTPVKRSKLAIGKVIGLSIIGIISGLSSFCGIMLSLPNLAKGITYQIENYENIYGLKEYLLLFLLIMSTSFFFVSLIAVISAYAKCTREATMMTMPVMILSVLAAAISAYGNNVHTIALEIIPVYNCAECLKNVLMFSITTENLCITIGANFIYSAILICVLTIMYNNEKIIFG